MNSLHSDLTQQLAPIIAEHFEASQKLIGSLSQRLSFKNIRAGENLWQCGEQQQYLYFLKQGLLYARFNTSSGKSICKEVYWEHDLVFGFRSLLSDVPFPFDVVALEDSLLLRISRQDYQSWVESGAEQQQFHLSVVSEYYMYKEGKEEFLLLNTPEQRVALFYETYPDLIRRIPQHIIASYLGITPISFSRIKKRLSIV